jgi:transposase-like protein
MGWGKRFTEEEKETILGGAPGRVAMKRIARELGGQNCAIRGVRRTNRNAELSARGSAASNSGAHGRVQHPFSLRNRSFVNTARLIL